MELYGDLRNNSNEVKIGTISVLLYFKNREKRIVQ